MTGDLFGKLFPSYDDQAYLKSLEIFFKRFEANRFSLEWFKGKVCLDAGCGGGRYSIALALIGAKKVYGIDISKNSIKDACKRAKNFKINNINFTTASLEKLPFKSKSFDFVICSGVIHHTANSEKAMSEIARVLHKGGRLYVLIYATGGIRWPLVQILRPIAKKIGFDVMDSAITAGGFPINKRRTYLDDLFVPIIDFYTWERLKNMLERHGFKNIKRWNKGRFDHEENLDTYLNDLKGFRLLFGSGMNSEDSKRQPHSELFYIGEKIIGTFVDYVSKMRDAVKKGCISEEEAMEMIIGQGHHRIIAWKGTDR